MEPAFLLATASLLLGLVAVALLWRWSRRRTRWQIATASEQLILRPSHRRIFTDVAAQLALAAMALAWLRELVTGPELAVVGAGAAVLLATGAQLAVRAWRAQVLVLDPGSDELRQGSRVLAALTAMERVALRPAGSGRQELRLDYRRRDGSTGAVRLAGDADQVRELEAAVSRLLEQRRWRAQATPQWHPR